MFDLRISPKISHAQQVRYNGLAIFIAALPKVHSPSAFTCDL
jgi:hypothetical protein